MDKKVININTLKIHGKDALTKDDNELFHDTLRKFVQNDIEDGKALLDMLIKLKEESSTSSKSYDELVEEEFKKLNDGIYIDHEKRDKFIQILSQNGVYKYALINEKFVFANYNQYQRAMLIAQNI